MRCTMLFTGPEALRTWTAMFCCRHLKDPSGLGRTQVLIHRIRYLDSQTAAHGWQNIVGLSLLCFPTTNLSPKGVLHIDQERKQYPTGRSTLIFLFKIFTHALYFNNILPLPPATLYPLHMQLHNFLSVNNSYTYRHRNTYSCTHAHLKTS